MTQAVYFPYTTDAVGALISTTDPRKIYLDKVLTLLSTHVGQRPVTKEYGTDWSGAFFENDSVFSTSVKFAINSAISRWLPDLTVASIDVSDIGNDGNAIVNIQLVFPDNTSYNLGINTSVFNLDGTITAV